jgi:hypothetical protein
MEDSVAEDKLNRLLGRRIIGEITSDTVSTDITELSADDLGLWSFSTFDVIFNKNAVLCIEFIFESPEFSMPYVFRTTLDIRQQKILTLDELIDAKAKGEFYTLVNKEIDREVDASVARIKDDPESESVKQDLMDCYRKSRNQKSFDFYIDDSEKSIILNPFCCLKSSDGYCEVYFNFEEIERFLKADFRQRVR